MKRLISFILALCLCLGLSAPALAAGPTFSDVPAGYWAYDAIERAFADGIINGTSHDQTSGVRQFSPENSLTLAHFVVIMTRAFYGAEVEASTAAGEWYAKNLATANNHGLMAGLGKYDMNANASRYQMAVVMANIMEDKGAAMPTAADLSAAAARIGDYAAIPAAYQEAVAAVFHLGIIQGTDTNGTFNGGGTMKRSHAAVIYGRLLDAIEGTAAPGVPDIPAVPDKPAAGEYTMTLSVKDSDGVPVEPDGLLVGKRYQVFVSTNPQMYDFSNAGGFDIKVSSLAAAVTMEKNAVGVKFTNAGSTTLTVTDKNGVSASITLSASGEAVPVPDTPEVSDTPETPDASSEDYLEIRREIIRLTNEVRAQHGVGPLEEDPLLMQAAQIRAAELKVSFSHTRPNGWHGGTAVSEAGYEDSGCGENITSLTATEDNVATRAVNNFATSSAHLAIMANAEKQDIGIGVFGNSGRYYVCMFVATPRFAD